MPRPGEPSGEMAMRHREEGHAARGGTWTRCSPLPSRSTAPSTCGRRIQLRRRRRPTAFAAQTWRLFELQAGPDSTPTQPNSPITLQFDAVAGRVSGTGGCNRYFAGAVVRDRKLTISAIGATRMACPAPAMAEESGYLAALERATSYLVEDEVLTLTLAGGGWLRYRKLLD